MKYQKRYKPKTKFEKFLKVYFIIGILVIVLTGVYAGVKSMQRKKEAASETIIHTVAVPKISLKKTEWVGKKRFVDCEFEPIKGAKRYYIAMSSNRNYTDYTEISANYKAYIDSLATGPILIVLSSGAVTGLILIGLFSEAICFTLYDKCIKK